MFRQLTSGIAHLNSCGIVHRDVHPTRIHYCNGTLKFNIIGLPYNFKKLLKNEHFSGHINYSAPEFMQEQPDDVPALTSKVDTWSLGCCLFYLATKTDPFAGKNITEIKQKILVAEIFNTYQPAPVLHHVVLSLI